MEENAHPAAGEVEAAAADPFQGEVPALEVTSQPDRRSSNKVIRLAEHRQAVPEKGLSSIERSAFREIGERLKKDSDIEGGNPAATADEFERNSELGADDSTTRADEPEFPFAEPQSIDASNVAADALTDEASTENAECEERQPVEASDLA